MVPEKLISLVWARWSSDADRIIRKLGSCSGLGGDFGAHRVDGSRMLRALKPSTALKPVALDVFYVSAPRLTRRARGATSINAGAANFH